MKVFCVILLLLLPSVSDGQVKPQKELPVNGMTISCPGSGRLWGSDAMVTTMRELKKLGVNWITIHPYAGIRNHGLVTSRLKDRKEAPQWISRPIEEAHKLGLKVLIKPHLAYWGSKFRWRGEINFTSEKELQLFFSSYEKWIVSMARMSRKADAFVVGTELDRLVEHKENWLKIIGKIRASFKGPLTYAANWSDFDRIPFWQELDVVGIQAYFPILQQSPGKVLIPTRDNIRAGWARIAQRMRRFSAATGKKICFTELGYNESNIAPFQPWAYKTGGANAEEIQTLCLEEALRAVSQEPAIIGSFLWKCFPGKRPPHNFNMHADAMKKTIASHWKGKNEKNGTSN